MAKVVLNDISNLTGNPTSAEQALNDNFSAIETALENTLSRDGTTPNFLEASLDANSQRIVNLPYALSNTEPVTLAQAMALLTGEDWTGGVGIPAVVYYQENEPTATATGQVWVRTSDLTIWIWTGTAWIRQADPNLTLAINTANSASAIATSAAATAQIASDNATQAAIDAAAAQVTADQAALDVITAQTAADTADAIADSALATANSAVNSLSLLSPRVTAVEDDVANVSLAIVEIENDVGVLAATIQSTTADLGDLTAVVQSETIARISGDTALASAINTIQSTNARVFIQASAPVAGVGGVPDPIPEGSFWYDSDDGNHPYRWTNGAWTSVQDEEFSVLTALIQDEQTARIAGDEALASDITTIQATRDDDYALIVANNIARINAEEALATSIDGVQANVDGLEATVISNNSARIAGDEALATSISVVDARVTGVDGDLDALSATVTANNVARVNGDAALASSIQVVDARVASAEATITSVNSASVTRDSALTTSINNLSTTVNGHTTTITQHTSSINGIEGKYSVKIDNNGYVTGFGLISTNNNATPTSTFTVLAQNFRIVTPGLTPVVPFQVVGGVTYIKDVRIDSAVIGTATIGTLNIAPGAVSDFAVGDFSTSVATNNSPTWTNVSGASVSVSNLSAGTKVSVRLEGKMTFDGSITQLGIWFQNGLYRLRRDDGVIVGTTYDNTTAYFYLENNGEYTAYAQPAALAWSFVDLAPVNASHTYTLQFSSPFSYRFNTKGLLTAQVARR